MPLETKSLSYYQLFLKLRKVALKETNPSTKRAVWNESLEYLNIANKVVYIHDAHLDDSYFQ